MTAIDLSSDIGLVALSVLTLNLLLGVLLSMRYNPWTHWPHRRFNYFKVHNWTGYVALGLCLLHPIVLLASSDAGFRVLDIIYPVHAPKQPWINVLGAVGLYALVVVVVTSYFRLEMGRAPWKLIHYGAYGAALLAYVHSILTDPTLKDAAVDPLDGEKVLVEVCLALALVAFAIRLRRRRERLRSLAPTPAD